MALLRVLRVLTAGVSAISSVCAARVPRRVAAAGVASAIAASPTCDRLRRVETTAGEAAGAALAPARLDAARLGRLGEDGLLREGDGELAVRLAREATGRRLERDLLLVGSSSSSSAAAAVAAAAGAANSDSSMKIGAVRERRPRPAEAAALPLARDPRWNGFDSGT